MAKIEWSDDLSIGIKEIDEQHRKSVDLFSAIIEAKEKNMDQELMNYIAELIEHWKMHFKYEESLMEEYDYSGITDHKRVHGEITNNISNLEKMYSKGFEYVISSLSAYLNLWIDEHIAHINSEDKKLGKYLNSKGIR